MAWMLKQAIVHEYVCRINYWNKCAQPTTKIHYIEEKQFCKIMWQDSYIWACSYQSVWTINLKAWIKSKKPFLPTQKPFPLWSKHGNNSWTKEIHSLYIDANNIVYYNARIEFKINEFIQVPLC